MAAHLKKSSVKSPLRRNPRRGPVSSTATVITPPLTAGGKAPASKSLAARQTAKTAQAHRAVSVASKLGRKPKTVPFDETRDRAERAKIAEAFDAAAFES